MDLWGGIADETTGRLWEQDTLVLVYSTTKGITAMGANMLAQAGTLDLDAPVADYWPEFAQAGKEGVTVTDLLSHRAGLAWVDGTMSVDDMLAWDPVIRALERQAPSWPPGTAHGYHATTYGWLVGEVIRRVTGQSVGTYVRDEIAGPLGADWYIGLPASEEGRVARLVSFLDSLTEGLGLERLGAGMGAGPGAGPDLAHLADLATTYFAPDGPLFKALTAPGGSLSDPQLWHSPRLHAAEIPAANGICDARSLARLYAACVSDVRAPSGETIRLLTPATGRPGARPADPGPRPGAAGPGHPVGARLHLEPGHHRRRQGSGAHAGSGTSAWVGPADGPTPTPSWPWGT